MKIIERGEMSRTGAVDVVEVNGKIGYLMLATAMEKVNLPDRSQMIAHMTPRFLSTRMIGVKYFAFVMPFLTHDSKYGHANYLDQPIMYGPFLLGRSGPAVVPVDEPEAA